MLKNTNELRDNLITKHGFSTDRELLKMLGIDKNTQEGISKMTLIFAWIEYQNAFTYNSGYKRGIHNAKETRDNEKSFNEGVEEGRRQVKEEMRELLK